MKVWKMMTIIFIVIIIVTATSRVRRMGVSRNLLSPTKLQSRLLKISKPVIGNLMKM